MLKIVGIGIWILSCAFVMVTAIVETIYNIKNA